MSNRVRRRSAVKAVLAPAGLTLLIGGASACSSCDEETETVPDAAPAPGRASMTELGTLVGEARALKSRLAPTSMDWTLRYSPSGERVILGGEAAGNLAVAIVSPDKGSTWTDLRSPIDDVMAWSAGANGTVVLSTGDRQKPQKALREGEVPPIESLQLFFARAEDEKIGAASVMLEKVEDSTTVIPFPAPHMGVIDENLAWFIVEPKPRTQYIVFGVPFGGKPPDAMPLPAGETALGVPFGQPPALVTKRGASILVRPTPKPGEPLEKPETVTGIPVPAPSAVAAAERCHSTHGTFMQISQSGKDWIFGVVKGKAVHFPIPVETVDNSPLGCSDDRVVIETYDLEEKRHKMAVCTVADGACTVAKNPAFREPQPDAERRTQIVATPKGVVVAVEVKSPTSWGLYLSQSADGTVFDVQRAVGEGEGDRSRYELGALAQVGARTLLLLSANLTGTNRRGWFLLASDDGGDTWGPP